MSNRNEHPIQLSDERLEDQSPLLSKSWLSLSMATLGILTMLTAYSGNPTQASPDPELSVASILADPTDGLPVILQGQILQPGDDAKEYVFSDGTGEITLEIEIDDEDFDIVLGATVEISGEVDLEAEDLTQHEAHPEAIEIDVYQLQVLDP